MEIGVMRRKSGRPGREGYPRAVTGAGQKPGLYKTKDGDAKSPLRAQRIGVEAFLVEEEDARTEGEEHDGEASGYAEAGDGRRGAILTATDDDVAGDNDEEFEDAAFEQPGDKASDYSGGVAEIKIEKNGPEQPKDSPEGQDPKDRDVVLILYEAFGEIVKEIEEFVAAYRNA
jgi:hypothetical protein